MAKKNRNFQSTKSTSNTAKTIADNSNVKTNANETTSNSKTTVATTTLAFKKENYLIMIFGIALLMIGLVVMSLDSEPFGFGFLGLTLGPLIVLASFIVQFFAIFYTKKQ